MHVDEYIHLQSPQNQLILRWLRQLLLVSSPSIREKISWGVPFYYCHGYLCYLNPLKTQTGGVDLAFLRGTEMTDEAGLLQTRQRKTVRSLVIRAVNDPDEEQVMTYIQEAILLNETAVQAPAAFVKKKRSP